ncbi:hypothetical protein AB0F36_02340, partial [Streptomyces sp. NPDC029080]|uniref:hypothetical protein n=1 Tax=Streptomyces sp. NPDC029080 TaxID=3155017 RepID=UPI0033CD23C6
MTHDTFNRPLLSTARAVNCLSDCCAIVTAAPDWKTGGPNATGSCQGCPLMTHDTFNRPLLSTARAVNCLSDC